MHIALLAALLCAAADPVRPPPESDKAAAAAVPAPAAGQPAKVRKKPAKPAMTVVLNVKRAREAELRLLPGIGKRRAQLIVERRDKKPFKTVDEVGRIKGMRALVQR